MKIRKSNKQDYKYLSGLYNKDNTSFLIFKKVSVKQIEELEKSPNRYSYILLVNKKPVGSFNLRKWSLNNEFTFGMIIDKKYQGKGYGQQALKLIEKEAKRLGCKILKLEVDERNLPAIWIYQKAEFEETRILINMEKKI